LLITICNAHKLCHKKGTT
jgi:hypothetical protein